MAFYRKKPKTPEHKNLGSSQKAPIARVTGHPDVTTFSELFKKLKHLGPVNTTHPNQDKLSCIYKNIECNLVQPDQTLASHATRGRKDIEFGPYSLYIAENGCKWLSLPEKFGN